MSSPLLEAADHLEVLLAGDTYLYGPEGHFVVRADHEHALDVPLADLLRRRAPWPRVTAPVSRLGELLVLAHGERDDRNRQHRVARVGDDLGRRREVGTRLGRRVEELDRHLVVDRLVGGVRTGHAGALDRAVRDLGHAADERRVRERVDLDDRRVADLDARDVGLVDLHLRLEHAHVADREQRCRVLVQRAQDRRLAFSTLRRVTRPAHRRVDGRLREKTLRITKRGLRLRDSILCSFELACATSTCVLSCSTCSSETRVGFAFFSSSMRS